MKGRVLAALGLCVLVFAVLAPTPEASGASQVVQGKITEVIPCTNPVGFVISVASSTEKYISKTGMTTSLPPNATPTAGQSAFITLGETTTCETRVGGTVTTVTGPLIAYLSLPDLNTTPPPPPGGTGGGQTGGSSSGSSIADRIQSIFQSIFGGGQDSTGAGTGTTGSTGGQTGGAQGGAGSGSSGGSGGVSPTNLGGMITVMLPCDPAQSVPTGTLFQVTVVGPLGGNYAYGPYTKDYQCGPLTPGKNIVGSYTPGAVCDLCLGPQTYCPSPQLGWINRMPGDGNSGCAAPPKDCTPARPAPSKCPSQACLNGTTGTTAYFPGVGGTAAERLMEGGDITSRGGRPYTVQDCVDDRAAGRSCKPITVARPQGACFGLGTQFTWPELVREYNKKYGLNLPENTVFAADDNYGTLGGKPVATPTIDVAQCALHNTRCFNKGVSCDARGCTDYGSTGGSFSKIGAPQAICASSPQGTTAPPPTSGDCAQGPVAPTGQCPQQGQTITAQNKAQMELNVRQALSQCKCTNASCASNTRGISVTSSQTSGGACGYKQDGVAGGCTDVSGLTCGSMSELCSLANACGGFTIGGGSECGHSGDCTNGMHGSGNAVDINHSASLDSCIKSRFQQIQCPRSITRSDTDQCWRNPATGAIYWAEPAVGRQGAHWHTCFNGYCR